MSTDTITVEGTAPTSRPLAQLAVLVLPDRRFVLVLSNVDGLYPNEVELIQKVADEIGAHSLVVLTSPIEVAS